MTDQMMQIHERAIHHHIQYFTEDQFRAYSKKQLKVQ